MQKPTLTIAKRMIKKANPAIVGLKVDWNHKPQLCDMAHGGGKFWSSVVKVTADDYRTRNMIFTIDNEGKWIR